MVPSKTSRSILQFSNDLTEKSEAIIASALSTSEVTQKLTQGLFPLFLTTSIIFSKKRKIFLKLNNLLYNYTCWKTLYLVYFGIKKKLQRIFFIFTSIRHLIHTLCKSKIIKNQYNIYSAIHSFLIPQHATLYKQLLIKYHHVVRNTVLVLVHACIDVFRIYTNNLHYYTNIHDRYLYIIYMM